MTSEYYSIVFKSVFGFLLLIFTEFTIGLINNKNLYSRKDTWINISLGIGNFIATIATNSFVLMFLVWIYQHRLFTIPTVGLTFWFFCFLADDFTFYWMHYISHKIRWFWASHLVHHSSENYNLTTGLRGPLTGNLTGTFIFWAWMPLVGFNPNSVLIMQSVSLIYQFCLHTEVIKKLPRFYEYVFNTPSNHRVHHGIDKNYIDKNFGGTLIIWDRIFRTFEPESQAPTYGVTEKIKSLNPLKIALHGWITMIKDLKKIASCKDLLDCFFKMSRK